MEENVVAFRMYKIMKSLCKIIRNILVFSEKYNILGHVKTFFNHYRLGLSLGQKEQQLFPITPNPIPKNTDIMADFKRIKRVRIRERNNGADYNIVVVVVGDATDQQVNQVRVQFNEPFEGPIPSQTTVTMPLTTINPEKDRTRYVYKKFTFEGGDPDEMIYNLTTTMLAKDGTQLGDSYTNDVVVEENCNAPSDTEIA